MSGSSLGGTQTRSKGSRQWFRLAGLVTSAILSGWIAGVGVGCLGRAGVSQGNVANGRRRLTDGGRRECESRQRG